MRFVLKRLVAQRLLGLAMVVTLAFSIGVLVAGPIYADSAREAILSSAVHSADVTVKNVRITTFGSGEFGHQRANHDLRRAIRSLPVARVLAQGLSNVALTGGRGTISVPLLFRTGSDSHLGTIRGRAAHGPRQIVLSRGAARTLRVHPGDTIRVSGANGKAKLLVTGIYVQPPDPTEDYWFGSLNPFPPPDTGEPEPAVMDEVGYVRLAEQLGLTSRFVWDVYLNIDQQSFQAARTLPGRVAAVSFPGGSPLGGAQVSTALPELLQVVEQRTANLRVPVYLVVFQIGAVALAVLAGVASLALSRQSFELAVLRSRGFTRAKLALAQAVQTALTAAMGYPLGLLIGMGLARLATHANGPAPPGTRYPIALSPTALVAGAVGALVGAIILLLLSLPVISRTILEERRQLSREARPFLARVPVELFVLPLGVAAFYEVKTRGFLPLSQSGSLDPLVVLAPTLLLFAASFLVLRLLLLGLRKLDRLIGSTKSLPAYLAGRRLGRSPGTSFAISLLLVLSVGLLVVSNAYRATVIRSHQDTAHQDFGADWQVQVAAPAQPVPAVAELPPTTTAVVRTEPGFNVTSFALPPTALAIDPATYPNGGWWRSDYSALSESDIMSRLSVPDPGQRLPGGTSILQLSYTVTRPTPSRLRGMELDATVERPDGSVATVRFGELGPAAGVVSAPVKGAQRILSVVVIEPRAVEAPNAIGLRLRLSAETGGGKLQPVDLSGWQALRWRGSAALRLRPKDQGLDVVIQPGAGHDLGGIVPPGPPLPALVSPEVASQEGQVFEADIGSQTLTFQVLGQAQGFPSSLGDFVVMPLRPVLLASARVAEPAPSITEVWAMGEADPRPGIRAAGFQAGRASSAARRIAVLSQLPQSLAVGMHFTAAAGGMGLVIIGVTVGLYFTQRRREFEFASLRAMGSGRGQISGVLMVEQLAMIVFAVVAGSALGFAVVRLMMPYFGKSLGAAFPVPVMTVDWLSLGAYGVAIAAATAVGLILALRALLSSSVTSVLRGEAE
jgi:FtsX-like permease family